MKKTILAASIGALLLGSTGTALAATTTPAMTDLIAQLQAQIVTLQERLQALKAAQTSVQTSQESIAETLSLIKDLKEGMTSDDVKLLQAALAGDGEVYPEKKITGYYGKLTTQAVKRFQKKYGISSTGYTGPLTRAKLNVLLSHSPLTKEKADPADRGEGEKMGVRFCLGVPPGHLIAKDWRKNQGDEGSELVIPLCDKIPPGIAQKLGVGTTTPGTKDTIAPVLSLVSVGSITHNGAVATWTTNELAVSKVFLSATSPVSTSSTPVWTENTFATSHSATLSGLSGSTTYYMVIEVRDLSGNKTQSSESSFVTSATPVIDTTAPVMSAISTGIITSTIVTITWNTDEAAKSDLYLATSTPVSTSSATWMDANFALAHSNTQTGLLPNTTYYFVLAATDAAGNKSYSTQTSFITLPTPDTTAPVISALSAGSSTSTTGTVTWTTNENATSKVYYSTTTPVDVTLAAYVFDATMVTSHSVNLTGLTASTTYYAIVESKDAANNAATSSQLSFTTAP